MPTSSTDLTSEVETLRRRVAQLEAELARGQGLIAGFQKSADFLRRHLQGLGVGLGLFSPDWRQAPFVSVSAETILGLSRQQIEDDPQAWTHRIAPKDAPRFQAAATAALAGESGRVEYRIARQDETRWIRSRVSRMMVAAEQPHLLISFEDVTPQKLAEDALRESEQRFRLLSNSAPIGIFFADNEGGLVYTNPRLQAIYGYTAGELMGVGFARVFHPEERDAALANWQRVAGTADVHNVERRVVNAAGAAMLVHVQSAPMLSPDGAVVGRVGTVEDITDRRRAELQLQRSEERYRMLAEHATDMISVHTVDARCLYASPACKTLLGYEPEEMIGRDGRDFIHPDDVAALNTPPTSTGEWMDNEMVAYRVRRKDGAYIWFETIYKLVPGMVPGDPLRVLAVSRDVTIRRQATERLRESETRLRSILNTVADGIVTVDQWLMIEQFNPGAQRLFGYNAQEVVGRHLGILIHAVRDGFFSPGEKRDSALRGFGSAGREVVGVRKDGTHCELEMRIGKTVIAGRTVYTAILHDISKRKRTEKMLQESEKLAATGRIAARIAHEINNPLAGIRNSFLLIKDAVLPDHPYFSYVRRIEDETERIARIVRQMFELYRPDYVTRREMEMDRTIRDVVALLSTVAPGRDVRLDVDTAGVRRPLRLPEDSVRQVLYNLIVNAIEASPEGGVVLIRAALGDQSVEILVADGGDGIPPELQSQIYEPFFTTKTPSGTGGLGLGLPISRGIVEAMQGTLDFESSPGVGTIFRVRIPTHDQETEHAHD